MTTRFNRDETRLNMPLTSFFRILAERPLHFLCSLDYAFLIYVKFNVA